MLYFIKRQGKLLEKNNLKKCEIITYFVYYEEYDKEKLNMIFPAFYFYIGRITTRQDIY